MIEVISGLWKKVENGWVYENNQLGYLDEGQCNFYQQQEVFFTDKQFRELFEDNIKYLEKHMNKFGYQIPFLK